MHEEKLKLIHHYWDQGLARYEYYDSHSIEWLRNTANQLALVNSLGATVSVALAAGMQSGAFMLPGITFFAGAILTLLAAFFAHRGNERYALEMKGRLQTLSEKNRCNSSDTAHYAEIDLREDVTRGDRDHRLAARLAYGSLGAIIAGALLLLPIVLCNVA